MKSWWISLVVSPPEKIISHSYSNLIKTRRRIQVSETFWTSQICACCSPHHCVGFLFFAWIPPGLRAASSSSFASSAAAPSLTHSLTHSHTLTHSHSLTHSFTHSLTPSLTHSLTHSSSLTQSLLEELRRAWPPLGRGCLSRGRCSTQSFLAAFRVAGAVHRASWRSCGARGRRWAAAAFLVARAVHRELPGCVSRGRRSTQSLQEELLPFAWQAQCTEPPGGAAARVAAAGPRLPFSWPAQYIELPGCLSRGRRSTQSLLEELRRAWPPLGRGCLSISRGRCSTQSFLAAFRVEGAVHRASWRSCGARGRRRAAAAFLVAGAVHRASWLPVAWQAQCTEPPGGAAARVAAAGPRLPFSWPAQYIEPAGAAAARGCCSHVGVGMRYHDAVCKVWRQERSNWHLILQHIRHTCHTQTYISRHISHHPLSQSPHLPLLIPFYLFLLPRSLCLSLFPSSLVLQPFRCRYALSWRCLQGSELSKSLSHSLL